MTNCVFGCDEPAVARVHDDVVDVAVCERHKLEIQSDLYTDVNTVELDPEPENAYETLERFPEGASHQHTVWELTQAHRYGTPYPVSGDHHWWHGSLRTQRRMSSVAMGTGFCEDQL